MASLQLRPTSSTDRLEGAYAVLFHLENKGKRRVAVAVAVAVAVTVVVAVAVAVAVSVSVSVSVHLIVLELHNYPIDPFPFVLRLFRLEDVSVELSLSKR